MSEYFGNKKISFPPDNKTSGIYSCLTKEQQYEIDRILVLLTRQPKFVRAYHHIK